MPEFFWLLAPVLFIISLVYTSVGLGGGSSYIAVFYLFGLPLREIPLLALFLGALLGTRKFSPLLLQRILASLLIIVSLKLGIGAL